MPKRSLEEILGDMKPEARDQVRDFADFLLESQKQPPQVERCVDSEPLLRFASLPARIGFSLFVTLGLIAHGVLALASILPGLEFPWWLGVGVFLFWSAVLIEFPKPYRIWHERGKMARYTKKMSWALLIIGVPILIECVRELLYWVLPDLVWEWTVPQWIRQGTLVAVCTFVMFAGVQLLRVLWDWKPVQKNQGTVTLING